MSTESRRPCVSSETCRSREAITETRVVFERAQGDDQVAFGVLHAKFDDVIRRYAKSMIGKKLSIDVDVDDVVGETWVRFLKHFKSLTYQSTPELRAFLRTKVSHVVAELARRGGEGKRRLEAHGRLSFGDSNVDVAQSGPGVSTAVGMAEMSLLIASALPKIHERYRDVLRDHCLLQKSLQDIAAERGLRYETVKKQLQRGRELLLEALRDDGKSPSRCSA